MNERTNAFSCEDISLISRGLAYTVVFQCWCWRTEQQYYCVYTSRYKTVCVFLANHLIELLLHIIHTSTPWLYRLPWPCFLFLNAVVCVLVHREKLAVTWRPWSLISYDRLSRTLSRCCCCAVVKPTPKLIKSIQVQLSLWNNISLDFFYSLLVVAIFS